MKEAYKDIKCDFHALPIIKIEINAHRLLCEKCLSESDDQRRQRLEMLRVKLNKSYQIEIAELKELKEQTDKFLELFQTKNMTQAKKIINKASGQVQKIIEAFMQKQLKEANKILKEKSQAQLQKWKMIDGKNFSHSYMQFEEQSPKIQQRILQLKQHLKLQIGTKLKLQLRHFYSNLFDF